MEEPCGPSPAMEDMFTMRPAPPRRIGPATALVHSMGPVRFVSSILVHSSNVSASMSLKGIHML